MRNISDLKENEVIHCKTEEEWNRVLVLMGNPRGLTLAHYYKYKEGSVIYNGGNFGEINDALTTGYVAISASDFPSPAIAPHISLTHTIGEYVAAQHDGKLYLFKGNQSMVLTKDIINHIKSML